MKLTRRIGWLAGAATLAVALPAMAQDQGLADVYRDAPAPIAKILDTPPSPTAAINPTRSHLALLGRNNLPSIAEIAEPEYKLGGYRINPANNGQANSRVAWLNALSFEDIATRQVRPVPLPTGFRYTSPSWSPDGKSLAFLRGVENGLELWVADVASGTARKLTPAQVVAVIGSGFSWLPDGSGLTVLMVPRGRGPAPVAARAPAGPIVQVNAGRTAPARTYQDLLKNAGDEALFDYYFTSQPVRVGLDGSIRAFGAPGIFASHSWAPSGRFAVQTRIRKPYSYNVPAGLFPAEIVIVDASGRLVRKIADLPLRDDVPIQFDSVAKGPRNVGWRADKPETLVWVEAQDGGDIRTPAPIRDRMFALDAPFKGAPRPLLDLKDRFAGVAWGRDNFAVALTGRFKDRNETRIGFDPSKPGGQGRVLLSRNYQDRYNDPGTPLLKPNARGFAELIFSPDGKAIYQSGGGATREGEFPFLARTDIASGQSTILWRAKLPYYESVLALLDDAGERFITRRESRVDPPNFYIRSRAGDAVQLTAFPDPAPQIADAKRELISYTRADGVKLSGTLYLPAGYDKVRDGPLPLLMWAYPAEFTDAAVAGQVVDTVNRFVRPGGISHLFLLTQGYAILDDPTMPIVGAKGAEPNDTYIRQLVASAQAAADEVVRRGVADPKRLAIGGHSYGAFMTANLLAHSDIFKTGIARSGAYNRTLTPFGFQAEQRSYWEATATYTEMSPFTHVKKINEPILLIHGEADDNSGTFPVQSELFYAALKGNGGNARYVVLPLEAHGYRARESVGHTLWEMDAWLDQHLGQTKVSAR